MKCYRRTLHRQEWGNWIVGKNKQVVSSSRFLKTYFWIYSFTILFHFFQTLFSTHNGSTSNPCCYWTVPPSNLLFSSLFSPTPFFFYYLHALLLLPACSLVPVVPKTMHLPWNWLWGGREGSSSSLTSSEATGVSEEVLQATGLSWEVELNSHCYWSCERNSVYKTFK